MIKLFFLKQHVALLDSSKAVLMLGLILILASQAVLAAAQNYAGWEQDSQYNQLYNPDERVSLKGTVLKVVEIMPLPGMVPGIGLLVETKKKTVTVHLGPAGFINLGVIDLQPGHSISIRGCSAEIAGMPVIMASKIKKSPYMEIKVRHTSNGYPVWLHSVAELEEWIRED